MGVRILYDSDANMSTIYCSVTGWSLGPVFYGDRDLGLDADEIAQRYLKWYEGDPRQDSDQGLERSVGDFLIKLPQLLKEEAEQEALDANS